MPDQVDRRSRTSRSLLQTSTSTSTSTPNHANRPREEPYATKTSPFPKKAVKKTTERLRTNLRVSTCDANEPPSAQEEEADGRQPNRHADQDDRGEEEGAHMGGLFPHSRDDRRHHGKSAPPPASAAASTRRPPAPFGELKRRGSGSTAGLARFLTAATLGRQL